MSLGKTFLVNIATLLLLFASHQAMATTYAVSEFYSGYWSANWDNEVTVFTHESTAGPNFWGKTISSISLINSSFNCVSCKTTETLGTGEKIFSSHTIELGPIFGPAGSNFKSIDSFYQGVINITGGTGRFAGATGQGTFTQIDFGIYNTDSAGNFESFNTNGIFTLELKYSVTTTPVPEPKNFALLALGIGLIAFVFKRKGLLKDHIR